VLAAVAVLAGLGCPTVDLGESPPAPGLCRPDLAYFKTVVWPELIDNPTPERGCIAEAGCHQQANGRSALRFITQAPLSDPDLNQNFEVATRFLNCGTPEASSFVTKPLSGIDPHGGGDLFSTADPEFVAFRGWFP
jgi:hypothetical protein